MVGRIAWRWLVVWTVALGLGLAAGCPRAEGQRVDGADDAGQAGREGAAGQGGQSDRDEAAEKLELVEWSGEFDAGWKKVDELVDEQKFEAALALVGDMLAGARQQRDSQEWVRCLIRIVQLRTALHGYETAVRFLREQKWPADLLAQTTLNLYYAQGLVHYARRYSYEIQQRERVAAKGPVDLKAWTMEQIYAEAQRAFHQVWRHREQLGGLPVARLDDYLKLNNFPRDIRPTLRDALVYLWVGLLADTRGWRPEQSNRVYRLDVQALLGSFAGGRVALGEAAVHPLRKIAFVLDDHERFHAAAGRAEAAFEARLERLRRLHAGFSAEAARGRLKADLKRRLPGVRRLPWWSVGMALLAEWTRAEEPPDHLVRARRIALEGRKAYPDSIGGKRCARMVAAIEQPAYQLEAMAADGARRRSIGVQHKNLDRLYFRAWRFDLKEQIEAADDYHLFPHQRQIQQLIADRDPDQQWQLALERPPDYELHRAYATPPLTEPGLYAVAASARQDFSRRDNVMRGVWMVIGDVVLTSRQHHDRMRATVFDGDSGQPLSGAEVLLYRYDYRAGHSVVAKKRTGADGRVELHAPRPGAYFLLARKGAHAAIDTSRRHLRPERSAGSQTRTLLFTDRSIYRPLQTVHFKAVVYSGHADQADWRTAPERALTVSLRDANNQVVAEKSLTSNDFGTASGSFAIPAGRMLGRWRLVSSLSGQSTLRVEEYKRPTFEVELLDPEQALRLNRQARLRGRARYYFGLPVVSAEVRWKVVRSPVYPPWWGYYRNPAAGGQRSQTVAYGSAALDDDGQFGFSFTPEADESLGKQISYRYRVSAEVTDEGGETRTAERSFRLGLVAVEARIESPVAFLRAGRAAELSVQRSDLDGNPAAGRGRWSLFALEQPARTRLPAEQPIVRRPGAADEAGYRSAGDQLRPRWAPDYRPQSVLRGWADGRRLGRGKLIHGEDGKAALELPALEPGAYRLRYTTRDPFGGEFATQRELLVAGQRSELALPALLEVERASVEVGGTARVLAASGLADQTLALEVYRRGELIERRDLGGGAAALIELPITAEDRGGFGLVLLAVRDHQLMQQSASVFVPWSDKQLQLEFATFRDRLRPGASETWTVKLRSADGRPLERAAAEVLAYMYDRSLDAFASHAPPDPASLYPNWAHAALWHSTLGRAPGFWLRHRGFGGLPGIPSLRGDQLQFPSGYALGGPGVRRDGLYRHRGVVAMQAKSAPANALAGEKALAAPEEEAAGERKKKVTLVDEARPSGRAEGEPAEQAAGGDRPAGGAVELRSDFSETAFFLPHLVSDADGTVRIEFEAPDSVTGWNVWVHAITRDLRSGALQKQARTVKELMVRPYLPRFLREGDAARIKVVVNNAAERELAGELDFDIIDPDSRESLLAEFGLTPAAARGRAFSVAAGGSTSLAFAIQTPARVGPVAFRVTARSGAISDGELRPIPVLPGRMHLAQSRFAVLRDAVRRELSFEDMRADDDPSRIHEQLVVTLDGQLFYSVLEALPYLIDYPYECTEQTLNRFVSTGILSSLFDDYPAVARMAQKMAERDTRLEQWAEPDPNRKMALEETPWLRQARGGADDPQRLLKVLDPRIAQAQRRASLAELKKAQTAAGGFPWFPGGPPSPYMTLYILHGFSKALEFGVEVPRDVIQRAWRYLHRHYVNEMVRGCMARDACWEFVTFINYVLSNYPGPDGKPKGGDAAWTGGVFSETERDTMLDFSFAHWKQHSPYLKGYLALTLARRDRSRDARLVWASVMDAAKQTADQGTYFAPEDRAWLWYNDTIETQAFALRTAMELTPEDPKVDGLVLWLFIHKKLNHWKSTRATAEVIYALAHYLKETGRLGQREQTRVRVGDIERSFVFEPDVYSGKKNQLVVPGERIEPKKHATVVVEQQTDGYQFASATWHFSTEQLPAEARGDYLRVERKYFRRVKAGREVRLEPLAAGARIAVGDEVEVQLSLTSKHAMEYVHLRDPRPAGFEPTSQVSRHRWRLGLVYYEEVRDSGQNFFFARLPVGEYPFKYRIRATVAGTFKAAPAQVQPMYAPEFVGYSSGRSIEITP